MSKISRIVVSLLLALLLIDVYVSVFLGLAFGFWIGVLFLLGLAITDVFLCACMLLGLTLHHTRKDNDGRNR